MRCPYCKTENRPGMAFCIECGESLDESEPEVAASAAAEQQEKTGRRFALRRPRGWEVVLGALILVAVLAYSAYDGWQNAIELGLSRAYRDASEYESNGQKAEALDAYLRAGDYRDAKKRSEALKPEVDKLKADYSAAVRAAENGYWWDAAYQLRQAAAIQISYSDVITRLAQAKAHNGPLLYRQAGPTGGRGIWWAESDGSNPHYIPYSDENTRVYAIAPDGNWAVYSLLASSPGGAPRTAFLINLRSGGTVPLSGPYDSNLAISQAIFRANSGGVYVSFQNRIIYYRLPAPDADQAALIQAINRPIYLFENPAAIDPQQGQMLLKRFNADGMTTEMHGRLYLQDPEDRSTRRLPAEETGNIAAPMFSADGRYLLYVVSNLPTQSADQQHVVTATVVVRDLQAIDPAAGRREIASMVTGRDATTVGWIEARFADGNPPGILLARSDGKAVTLARINIDGTGERQIASNTAQQSSWIGSLRLTPDGSMVAGTGFAAASGDYRPQLFAQELAGGAAALLPNDSSMLTRGWYGFTPDGRHGLFSRSSTSYREDSALTVFSANLPQKPGDPITVTKFDETFTDYSALENHIAVLNDSRRVLLTRADGDKPGIYAVNIDGSDPLLLVPDATELWTAESAPGALLDTQQPSAIFAH